MNWSQVSVAPLSVGKGTGMALERDIDLMSHTQNSCMITLGRREDISVLIDDRVT